MRKKKAQKAGTALAVLAMTAALLAGCGNSSQTALMANRSMAAGAETASMDVADNVAGTLFRASGSSSDSVQSTADDTVAESGDTPWSDGISENEVTASESEVQKEAASEEGSEKTQSDRKLITTVDLSAQTREFEKFQKNIEKTVTDLGGYIEDSTVYNNNYWSDYDSTEDTSGSRSASYTLRIPEKRLDEFLKKLHDGANVTRESRSVTDITLEYVDVSSRKRALQTEAESLEKMMKQATELSDIIQIQSELTDVRYQIDSIESQLRTYDNQVDYSTVNLDVDEVKTYTQPANADLWTKISTGFMQSLKDVGNGILNAAVWIAVHIPQLVLAAVVLALAILIGKKTGKRIRRKIRKPWRRGKQEKSGRTQPENAEENQQKKQDSAEKENKE